MKTETPIDFWFMRSLAGMTVLVTLGWLLGIQPFFRKYLGDAVQWATYHETSQGHQVRRTILRTSSEVFKKILVDDKDKYDRVVVLAHSLGSVIAHDTLLYLQADPANAAGIKKISHFITYGSPIDKFAYFFETFQGQTPRYEKTVNDLRGSLFDGPAGRNLIWQNFYEEGDPIGGTIHTAGPSWDSKAKPLTAKVQSVYTANANVALISPNHTGYIANKMVLAHIWEALMPKAPPLGAEPTQVDVMAHTKLMRQLYAMILLVPWALLASYVSHGAHVIQIMIPEHFALIRGILGAIVGLSIIPFVLSFVLSKAIHLLRSAAYTLFILVSLAVSAALTAPSVETSPINADVLISSSIIFGLALPVLLFFWFIFKNRRFLEKVKKVSHTIQIYQPPNHLFRNIILFLVVTVIVTATIHIKSEQALLPWWWWRTTFLYATFSLIILSASQLLWKGKPGHMLN